MHVNRLCEIIEKNSLSAKSLATAVGIGYPTLSNYIKGRNAIPSDILIKICSVLDVTPSYLLMVSDNPAPEGGISYQGWSLTAEEARLVIRHRESPEQTMSDREFELISYYRALSNKWGSFLLEMARSAAEASERNRTRGRIR